MTGIATAAMAQEQTQETEKPGFFKQAFRDMKDSAKRQRKFHGPEDGYQDILSGAEGYEKS